MYLSDLKLKHVSELLEMATELEGANRLRKQELIFALLKAQAKKGECLAAYSLRMLRAQTARGALPPEKAC